MSTATCDCGQPVVAVPVVETDDWAWADADGHVAVALPPIDWEALVRDDIATYSALSARQALGMLPAFHAHRPAVADPYVGVVPWCCDMPMRLAPSGWRCREGCDR